MSQVDPVGPVEVAVDFGTAGGDDPWVADSEGAEPGGAEPERVEPGGAELGVAESEGAELERLEPGGVEPGGAESRGAEPRLHEWYARRCRRAAGATGPTVGGASGVGAAGGASAGSTRAVGGPTGVGAASGASGAGAAGGAAGAGAAGAASPGGAGAGGIDAVGGPAGVGATGGAGAAGPGGAGTGGTGAVATGGAVGAGAAGGTGAGGAAGVVAGDPGAEGTGAVSAVSGGAARPRLYYVPLLQNVLGFPPSSGPTPPLLSPPPPESPPASPESRPASRESRPEWPCCLFHTGRRVPRQGPPSIPGTNFMTLRPSIASQCVPQPSPPASSLRALTDSESDSLCTASPTVTRLLAIVVTDPSFEFTAVSALVAELVDFATHYCLGYAASLVAESVSASVCPPSVGGESALGTDVLEDRQEEFECFAAAVPHLVSMLLAPEGDPDAPDIPTPRFYAEVKRPSGSPPVFKARYVARGFSQRQGVDFFQTFSPTPKMTTLRVLLHDAAQHDSELPSLEFSTAFLQGSLHEEIWLRRPLGFTGSFPAGTRWSLQQLVYGLHQAPCEWHDTLPTALAALGFAPCTADPSLFLRTNATMPLFYVLVYVLQRFGFTYSSPQSTPLPTGHLLSAPPSDESVEPSGPYLELVGCLMYLMTCTQPDLAYPLSLLARYVAPVRRAWGSCLEDGLELSSLVMQTLPGSSSEAEIYAGAMAAQELRWLTYLLTDLGEAPRSPPVLYVDNKAMLALCQEHRLEHRTKHIALRYFLARELQQRGQLHLAYVASRANTADVFSKALQPCDHQCFCTVIGLLALPFLTGLVTSLARHTSHDTLCMTLAALDFFQLSADLSLFVHRGSTPFFVLVYVDDLVFVTPDQHALAFVKEELQRRHTCTDLGELQRHLGLQITCDRAAPTISLMQSHMVKQILMRFRFPFSKVQLTPLAVDHGLMAPPSDEPFESCGPYPELVGCLMVAKYVASTSGMGLVLGGKKPVTLTGFTDSSWADDDGSLLCTQGYYFSLGTGAVLWRSTRASSVSSSCCKAEVYAAAMAAQELRWLNFLLTDLGERPRSPPVLFADNRSAVLLCE
ncbi:unnamed protein product [Closterium sp. NIES-53]